MTYFGGISLKAIQLLAVTLVALVLSGAGSAAAAPSTTVETVAPAAVVTAPQSNICGRLGKACEAAQKGAEAACNTVVACAAVTHPEAVANGAKTIANPGGALKDWVVENGPEAWAKSAATGSAQLLAKIQSKLLKATKPELFTDWLSVPYGASWLLGICAAAFAQARAIAGMASASPEAREAVRDATVWSAGYMVAVTIAPIILMSLVDLTWTLARQMGDASQPAASSAISNYIEMLNGIDDPDTQITGGVISLFLFAGLIFLGAATALIELTIGEYGFYILAILLPFVGGLAVFPRWRKPFWMVIGGLVAVLLAPPALFLCYWVFWGGAAGTTGTLNLLTYMAVVGLLTAMAPIALMFVVPMLAPAMGGGAVAAASSHIRRTGTVSSQIATRQSRRMAMTTRNAGNYRAPARQPTAQQPKAQQPPPPPPGPQQQPKQAPAERGQQSRQPAPGPSKPPPPPPPPRSQPQGAGRAGQTGPAPQAQTERRGGRQDQDRR